METTGKVFTNVGHRWIPTGRTFTIDGTKCPLTRITSTIVVPPKKPLPTKVVKITPPSRKKLGKSKATTSVVQIILWYLYSGCSKHVTGQRSQFINFVNKFMGTVRFGNDQVAAIMGYGDYQIGNGKARSTLIKTKSEDSIQEKLYLLHMDICGPMRIESINGKKRILVIVDDYSRFTWVKFLRLKDETPEFIIKILKQVQVRLNATARNIRMDNGTEFVNQTLKTYYEDVRISHETSVAHTLQQNGVVER
ncbi:retrovirus-related pol polyprotein from transposon TNT 1-94 [Tanacetum coccineum]